MHELIERLKGERFFDGQIIHVEELSARPPRYAEVPGGLRPLVSDVLARAGIEELYSHQAAAIGYLRDGQNVVIVTGTASGKTLCYTIPTVEALMEDRLATVLCIYPTKALAQDQLRAIGRFNLPDEGFEFLAGAYDGDTPSTLRNRLRDAGNVLLTNPDMLSQGILPHHARWNRFFSNLKFIVIDEVHAYRGVFGSHVANVMRRVKRVCDHYGSSPQFVCCSATIANPREHAENITGAEMALVDEDGAPRGPKHFVMWNPPPLETAARGSAEDWRVGGDRKSPLDEAVALLTALVQEGVQTIAFVRTRLAAELIFKKSRDILRNVSGRLSDSIQAYRGGYLPEERREIERRLADKEILGVASTNALELGIDIGSLDACIIVGYPGTIASLWQQSGRAGRGAEDAVIFLVGQNSPIDQYLMAHSGYLFDQTPESAVVDPDNPHVTIGHLKCAAYELPVRDTELADFGPYADVVMELLEDAGSVKHIGELWHWSSSEYPAANVNLRNIAGPVYTIQDDTEAERVIGTIDETSALSQLHDHAVYIHGADTYFVNRLDIDQKIAFVDRRDLDYYTQSVQTSQIQIDETDEEAALRGGLLGFGDVTVTTSIPMFKKIRFESRDSLGFEEVQLPPQCLETVAMWFAPPDRVVLETMRQKTVVGEALIGIANVLVEVVPLYVMCDTQDIGATVDSSCLGRDAIFIHDRYPGGMGYAHRCMEGMEQILHTVHQVIRECTCRDGCPSCVGSAVPAFAMTDLDTSVRGRIPDKNGALVLLDLLLGSE